MSVECLLGHLNAPPGLLCVLAAIPEGFSVDVQPLENPLEQEKVSLCCSADNYTYEQLQWYRINPEALKDEQGKPRELDCRSVHHFADTLDGQLSFQEPSNSWVLDFTIPSIGLKDEGHYVCEAQSRRSGEKQCLFRYISVKGERELGMNAPDTDIYTHTHTHTHKHTHTHTSPCVQSTHCNYS